MMVSKKNRVLIVHNYYRIPGGEDTVVTNEKKLLETNGHKVYLYSRHNNEIDDFSKIRKVTLPLSLIFNFKTYREVKYIIKEKKIDIIHVHNTLNLISPSVYYAALFCKVPVIQTIHNFRLLCPGATFYRDGNICEDCIEHGLGCAVRHSCYRESKLQTLACIISTKFHRMLGIYGKLNYICLTAFNRDKLLTLKQINPEKVFVKPNFVESMENIISYDQRKNQFVFVGRLDTLKGIDILLESWMKMGNSAPKLIICGTGPMEDWCQRYIADNGLMNVEMMGYVPNNRAKRIIANSKALILPTQWYEGFPMTIVEAYSVGTAVIGSSIGNVGTLIEEGKSGLRFQCDSVEQLVAVIEKFQLSSFSMGEDIRMRYTAENNYRVLMDIYNKAYL